jgi:hypothetical protein
VADSRRARFEVHTEDQARLLRCLLCQQWIDADHAEALDLDDGGPTVTTPPEADAVPVSDPVR